MCKLTPDTIPSRLERQGATAEKESYDLHFISKHKWEMTELE